MEMVQYIKDITTPAACFMGEYDSSVFYDYGAIAMRYGNAWIFDGKDWHELGMANELDSSYEEATILEYRTNCPNCGAKVEPGTKFCPECGTKLF